MTPKKEERIEKEEAWEISKLKPIWTKTERKREKENKNSLYQVHTSAYCKFGIAPRNEAISTEELTKKLWAIVLK